MSEAPKIGQAFIEIRGDSSKMTADAKSAGASIMSAVKAFGPAIASALGAWKLADTVKSAANLGDELYKTSQRVGVAVSELSALKYAADMSGTSLQGMVVGLRNLSRVTIEAAQGGKQAQDAFQQIGIQIRNDDGTLKDNNTLLGDIADKFKAMPDGAEKTALAMELMGRSGTEMIPMLNEGRAGLEKLHERAVAFGLVIGPEFGKQAQQFNDNLDDIRNMFTGISLDLGKELIPALNTVIGKLLDFWTENGPAIRGDLRAAWISMANAIVAVGQAFDKSGGAMISFFKLASEGIIALTTGLTTIGTTMASIIQGVTAGMLSQIGGALTESQRRTLTDTVMWANNMRKAMADATVKNIELAQSVWNNSAALDFFDEQAGQVSGSGNRLATTLGEIGDMAKLTGQQLWEMIGALMQLSPMLGGFGAAVAAPGGGTFETIGGSISGITANIQRQFGAGIAGMGPAADTSVNTYGTGIENYLSLIMPGFESMGATLQQYINAVAEVDLGPIETFGSAFTNAWSVISQNWQETMSGMFSSAIVAGVQGGGKKMLQAIGNMFGQLVQMFGQLIIKWGIGTVALSLFPPNAAGIAKGMAQIAAGGALVAFGAMLGGGGAAAGGGMGSYSSMGGGYGYQTQTAPQPINYALGSPGGSAGTTVININALDAASFNDFVAKPGNADAVAGAVVNAARLNHPVRDHLNM